MKLSPRSSLLLWPGLLHFTASRRSQKSSFSSNILVFQTFKYIYTLLKHSTSLIPLIFKYPTLVNTINRAQYRSIITISNPTLDSIPQLKRNFTLKREEYGSFIAGMQETGYHKWGFVIYRTTYDDDDAFQRYIALMY